MGLHEIHGRIGAADFEALSVIVDVTSPHVVEHARHEDRMLVYGLRFRCEELWTCRWLELGQGEEIHFIEGAGVEVDAHAVIEYDWV